MVFIGFKERRRISKRRVRAFMCIKRGYDDARTITMITSKQKKMKKAEKEIFIG